MEDDVLPHGWAWAELGVIASVVGGGTPRRDRKEFYAGGVVPWATPTDIDSERILTISQTTTCITEQGLKGSSARLLPVGTVLFSSRASIGKIAIAGRPLATNQGFANLIPRQGIDSRYLAYCLKHYIKRIKALGSGTTYLEVAKSSFRKLKVPIPPTNEQKHIGSEIEELLQELWTSRQSLQKVPTLLKQFRRSVLAKAFSGNLTERDPSAESVGKSLEGIRQERWKTLEGDIKAKGRNPRGYEDPYLKSSELESLYELPENWTWTQIRTIGKVVTGKTPPTSNKRLYGDVVPFVKPADLDVKGLVTSPDQHLSEEGGKHARLIPPHSVMVTSIGATIGKTGISGTHLTTNQQINSIILSNGVDPFFVYYYCLSDFFQNQVRTNASSTTLPIINKSRFELLPVPFAPVSEQKKISTTIAAIFAEAERAENLVSIALMQVDRLWDSILAKAFRGELVLQDPDDEPATVLLERTRDKGVERQRNGEV